MTGMLWVQSLKGGGKTSRRLGGVRKMRLSETKLELAQSLASVSILFKHIVPFTAEPWAALCDMRLNLMLHFVDVQ